MTATLVDAVMKRPVVTLKATATARRIAQVLADKTIGSVVILDEDDPVGIVTERDLVTKVLAAGTDPDATTAAEVMSGPILTIGTDAHIDDAVAMMEARGVHHLLAVHEGRVRGIVSATDVARLTPELERRLRGALSQRWED